MCNFGHLHAHSEYSTLDGMGRIREMFEQAKSLGQSFLAITDHGTMAGLWEAQRVADELNMKLILGNEFYYEREGDGENGHLLVLAKNNTGLLNMKRLQAWASKHNFKKKPRITFEKLSEYSEGLIVTSACLGSAFNQFIMNGEVAKATEWARKFKQVFGEDFYIELQPNAIPEQQLCNTTGIRIARQLGIQLVATNDVHYVLDEDCFPHEVLLAMQTHKKMQDEKRFKFSTNDFWLKSEQEMYDTFDGLDEAVIKEAIENTVVIADKCDARLEKGHFLPQYYDVPEGETPRSILAKNIMKGLKERGFATNRDFVSHVQHELDVIDRNGYSDYFLIVGDFVTSAKERGELVGEGRGSGAGSKVAYTTRITEIPPHEYDLLFERFMADGREPDFDVDFSDQEAVFRDLQAKYGEDNVSRIIAFGRMTPKSVARKVLNTFGHPEHVIKSITSLIGDGEKDLFEAIEREPKLKAMLSEHQTELKVMERLQNVISHLSKHAGGVLIYPNLQETVPLKWDKNDEMYTAEFDKYMLEELGHFKFDILGLETLPILHTALRTIRETGVEIELASIDMEDKAVYDMISRGDVSGLFQINNQATKVMQQRPSNFRDLIAINALIRPGVGDWDEYLERRAGKEYQIYEPRRPYMDETVGTMTYQEQFLLDCHKLAGWSIAYADKQVRKNKNIRGDEALRTKFIEDCTSNGHPLEEAQTVWAEIEDAVDGGYSFNKSHSASYATLTYQTAYLKHHYPIHFYSALMNGAKTDGDGQREISGYIAECKARGIAILPPDINLSGEAFIPTDAGITYKINTISHVGDQAVKEVIAMRPIVSFQDFLERRNKTVVKKNIVINLIKAGAFDSLNPKREELLWEFDMWNRTKTQIKNEHQCERYEADQKKYMEWEKQVLNMYLSSHPMDKYGFHPLDKYKEGERALQGGEVIDVYEFHPKKNPANPKMAFISINTLYGIVKVVCFPRDWTPETKEACSVGNLIMINGSKSGKDILLDKVEVLT